MEFRVLGPVEVRHGDQVAVVSGRLRGTLLGVLLARANEPVSVDVLADILWDGRPDPRASHKLQLHVHRLRGLLDDPDRLSFGVSGYQLRAHPDEIDAERFHALVDAGTAAAEREPQHAIEALRTALALWRGVPFVGVDTPVLADWAQRLAELRLTAIESLHQAELACGLHGAVIGDLSDLVTEHPLRERSHALLMTALYRAGRRSDALAAFDRVRDVLVSELGLEPGPELRELHRRILADDLPARPAAGQPTRSEVPAQLPVDVRGFVGRQAGLAELTGLLSTSVRICAVTGTAGVGKTALAVRWGHGVRDRFPDGQLYVDLRGYGPDEPVSTADVLAGFLRSLGLDGTAIPENLDERAARFRTLVDGRRMLIVLDNARTVEQVRPLLPAGSTCFTLVTSRDSMTGLAARHGVHRIGLDRLPSADATRLLSELLGRRAEDEPAAVDALVERCARLPLALRITAELVRSRANQTVGELVGELAGQQDTLDLLDVDGDPHTAVRAVFSWSYHHLGAPEARVFRLLGLHPGHDVDAHAVAAMAGTGLRETRRALDALVRAHLVDRGAGERYQPHDLLRVYAAELAATTDPAAERAAALSRLFDFYLATAAAAMDVIAPHEAARRPETTVPDAELPVFDTYDAAFAWLDGESANLLTTVQHGGDDYVLTLSDIIWRYLGIAGLHHETIALYTRALHAARERGDIRAEANTRRGLGATTLRVGLVSQAVDHLTRALELSERLGDLSLRAPVLNNLGAVHWRRGDLAAAVDSFRRAIADHQRLGHDHLQSPPANNLARVLSTLGRYEEARELFERTLVLVQESGDRTGEASALNGLARVNAATGRSDAAIDYARRALAVAEGTGNRSHTGTATRWLGVAHLQRGEPDLAIRHLGDALRIARRSGEPDEIMATLNELGAAHASAGNPTEALRCYREALTTGNEHHHRDLLAHALAGLGDVHAALGDLDQAREHRERAQAVYRELGMPQADALAELPAS